MTGGVRTNTSADDAPPYVALLKLHTLPFSSKNEIATFYANAQRSQYLDMLLHLTQFGDGALLVVADKGVGKSTLLGRYLERKARHWNVCRIDGDSKIVLEQLYGELATCYALDTHQGVQQLEFWRQHLCAMQESELPVLVVDDAEQLSDDALEMVLHLGGLEGTNGKLIRLVMFADSAIESRLGTPRFNTIAPPHRLQLKPLQETEIAAYLSHRLRQCGYRGNSPFTDAELKRIYQQGEGVPARLNAAAHATLMQRVQGKRNLFQLSSGSLRMVAAVALLTATLFLLHDQINMLLGGDGSAGQDEGQRGGQLADSAVSEQVTDGQAQEVLQPPAAIATVEPSIPRSDQPGIDSSGTISVVASEAPPLLEGEATIPLVIKPEMTTDLSVAERGGMTGVSALSEESPAESPVLDGLLTVPVIASAQPQSITFVGRGLVQGSRVAVSWAGKVMALEPRAVVVRDDRHMEITLVTGDLPGTWAAQVSTPANRLSNVLRFQVVAPEDKEVVETVAEALPPKAGVGEAETPVAEPNEGRQPATVESPPDNLQGEARSQSTRLAGTSPVLRREEIKGMEWVKAQPDGYFTLQLLAASEHQGLEQFLAENPALTGPFGSFAQQNGDRQLNILVQGSFPDRDQAEAAAQALPGTVKPWLRDFAGIKKVMSDTVAPTGLTEVSAAEGVKDTAWVWSQDPAHFTLQLAGAADEASLEAVMRGMTLPGELVVVQTLRNAQVWYVLIYGRFASKEAAQGTIERLPASLKASGPWIRQFADLQSGIGQASGR